MSQRGELIAGPEGPVDGHPTVLAVLRGGPRDLPGASRTCYTDVDSRKIKVVHLGGYEHFERDDTARDDSGAVLFEWTSRTCMAE